MDGYFGIGIEHGKDKFNYGTLFRSAAIFGASFIFVIGQRFEKQSSDTVKSYRHIPTYSYKDFKEFESHRPYDCPLIGVELMDNATELKNLIHPKRCIYLLGAEDHGLTKTAIKKCQKIITIPTCYSLNVSVAGSIIMYDRIVKY